MTKPRADESKPKLFLVMGVTGSGKTTVGKALAATLEATFLDADDFHPPANVAKMTRGEPLTDADRAPWLDRLHEALQEEAAAGRDAVLACSALKRAYRERLLADLPAAVFVVYLEGDYDTLRGRMQSREHFMPPSLLQSQLDTLEPPHDAITVDIRGSVESIVAEIVRRAGVETVRSRGGSPGHGIS